ncbi:putative HTH-type transcriptional regulator TtgW [Burkholderia lata]|uniref:Putative HTH-type transcriptional regulator TtgW n=1 Tax=Burkholderia lata (strain ATCC 17760 / DSM 23089 / LMG 22485 / NCIMB 9086 / R18194 / 383) TaxID=482957 RepID=A0A6P2Y545_BURL3|nr:TetR/AcrR family transcriptional regulator [Burkholderia lata]VWD17302.1 putative HTH-type transcriptional regulator TtgW [Burkholderia lata]
MSKARKIENGSSPRSMRADAQRNIDTLLRTALEVFESSGVDAPVREIAQKAGVGIGTIYRHFPQRSDLVVAALCSEVDTCAELGVELSGTLGAGDALVRWIEHYVEFVTKRRGLAAAMNSGDPAFRALPLYFLERLQPVVQDLLDSAVAAGEIREGVQSNELLCAVGALCAPLECPEPPDARRLVALFIDGLRYGAHARVSRSVSK